MPSLWQPWCEPYEEESRHHNQRHTGDVNTDVHLGCAVSTERESLCLRRGIEAYGVVVITPILQLESAQAESVV